MSNVANNSQRHDAVRQAGALDPDPTVLKPSGKTTNMKIEKKSWPRNPPHCPGKSAKLNRIDDTTTLPNFIASM
jgi:hypothetical protein